MNSTIKRSIALAGITAGIVLPMALIGTASAASSSTNACAVKLDGKSGESNVAGAGFIVSGNTATAKIVVTDPNGCDVTIADWQAPTGAAGKGMPYDQQTLYKSQTLHVNKGSQSLTIELPNCYYQVDVLHGTSATGTYTNGQPGGPIYAAGTLLGSLHGGATTCTPVVTPTPVSTPTPVVTPAPTGGSGEVLSTSTTSLPTVGAGDLSVALSGLGGAVGFILKRRSMR